MSNKNDPKYQKIKGKLERIIPLPEPQQSLALHRIAREEQESFDKIEKYFNRLIWEKIHEKLDRINNERDNIEKLRREQVNFVRTNVPSLVQSVPFRYAQRSLRT